MFGEDKSKKADSTQNENDFYDKEDGSSLSLMKKFSEKVIEKAIQEEVVTMSGIYLPCITPFLVKKNSSDEKLDIAITSKGGVIPNEGKNKEKNSKENVKFRFDLNQLPEE
ncbi:hypothetical protein AgCh_022502 [Apium graveolens]